MALPSPDFDFQPPARRGAVAVIRRGEQLLVIRRSAQVAAPLSFCFPGGGIDLGESEEAALVREIQEEIAVTVEPLRRLWSSVTPWGVELAWWLASLDDRAELVANPLEVESVHWLTPDQMLALGDLLESNRHFLAALAAGQFSLD